MCICACICVNVYMHMCVCMYIYTCGHMSVNLGLHVCLYMYLYTYMYLYMCLYVFGCMCIYVYACMYMLMYVCMCMLVHLCMRIYTCVCMCICMCCVTLCLGRYDRCLLTPNRELRVDQSRDTSEVPFGESVSYSGATHRSMREGLVTGAGMTRPQLHHQTPPQDEDHSSKLGAWSVLHSPEAAQLLSRCLFWVALQVSSSSRQLSWPESVSQQSSLLKPAWGREGPRESCHFQ